MTHPQLISLDFSKIEQKAIYRMMIGAIVPRPIAFVTTQSAKGVTNLAPFSFFNGIASNPATVMISVTKKGDGTKKDTLRNIEETGQFVVNSVNEWILGPMNQCSAEYPYGVNEMEKVGLTPLPSLKVKPPRVQESAIQFECEVYKTLEIGDPENPQPGSATLIVGKILMMHISEKVYDSKTDRILLDALKPIGRLAGNEYCRVGQAIELPRPKI